MSTQGSTAKGAATEKKATLYDCSKLIDVEAIKRDLEASSELPVYWVSDFDALEACLDDLETRVRVALVLGSVRRDANDDLACLWRRLGYFLSVIRKPCLDQCF